MPDLPPTGVDGDGTAAKPLGGADREGDAKARAGLDGADGAVTASTAMMELVPAPAATIAAEDGCAEVEEEEAEEDGRSDAVVGDCTAGECTLGDDSAGRAWKQL